MQRIFNLRCKLPWLPACCQESVRGRVLRTAPLKPTIPKVNRNDSQPTADQQKLDRSDRDIARQIRQSVVKDKSLSTYAHNVKIISQNGAVTLRGPVRSEDEKRAIEADAAAVVGQDKVTSEIEVQPKK